MQKLITPEMLEKYLTRHRTIKGKRYEVIFEYNKIPVTDLCGNEIAHDVIIGFKSESGEVHSGHLFLPIPLGNGLLTKNKTTWHAIHMVIPPLRFYGPVGKLICCLNELISSNREASSLDDFFPGIHTMKVGAKTPLYTELLPQEPLDVNDLNNWNVIGIELAIIELFNNKIEQDIIRSQRGGFNGISASIRALHTVCRAFCRFTEDEDDTHVSSAPFSVIPEEMLFLGSMRVIDKQNAVILHEYVKRIDIRKDAPIDFCSCSQSQPIRTGRLKDGITIQGARFAGTPVFPYTRWRRAIVGITRDDPRRVIVSRSITRALRLDEPNEPYALTDVVMDIDSLSLPGIRMTHPLTHEDGLVVSETFARRAGAYKLYVEKVSVPVSARVLLMKEPYTGNEIRTFAKRLSRSRDEGQCGNNRYVINRGDVLMVIQYTDLSGEPVTKEIRTNIKTTGMITAIERFIPATDLDDASMSYRFVSIVYYPLEVGDKIADAHGNKATVSAIWPDIAMPVWESAEGMRERAHYIATPFIMKRLAIGAEIEDKYALAQYMLEKRAYERGNDEYEGEALDSLEQVSLDQADVWLEEAGIAYTGTVTMGSRVIPDVPLSLRRLFRLDNNVRDTLNSRHEVTMNTYGRTSLNARMGIDIVTMLSRGAHILVHKLVEKSGASSFLRMSVVPILYAVRDTIPEGAPAFQVTEKLDRDMLGNPCGMDVFSKASLVNTVCDPRIMDGQYGYISLGRQRRIVIPPHEAIIDMGNGAVTVGKIAISANRVLTEQQSYNQGYHESTNVAGQVERYHHMLSSILAGKNGLVRNVLFPVFPTTIRSVATSYLGDNPLEICLPQSEFNRLMRLNPEFRGLYKNESNWYCIVKRDPVHTERNLFTVPFKLWKQKSIGISPLLINSMHGDFDGDTLFALFPTDIDSFLDAKKLIPRFEDIYEPSKHLADTDAQSALQVIQERTGWTSVFRNPHASDTLRNPVLFEKLVTGMSMDELCGECVSAARDFEIIKDGTAQSGALGLSFIFSRKPEDTHILSAAMELYHVLAQNTLDAKSGVDIPALRVIEAVRKGDRNALIQSLNDLGFTDEDCCREFLTFAYTIRDTGGRLRFLSDAFPVLGIIQRGASYVQTVSIANRCVEKRTMGDGIWEALMDYLLFGTESSPYAWAERNDILSQRIKGYTETLHQKFHQ